MSQPIPRRSPIQHLLEARNARFLNLGGGTFAVNVLPEADERAALETLALCDLSGQSKLGLKGSEAVSWLTRQNVEPPAAVYATRRLGDAGIVARIGPHEFLLEGDFNGQPLLTLAGRLRSDRPTAGRLELVERQEATFVLVGVQAGGVLSQTCSINFDEVPSSSFVWTRVAAINCGIVRDTFGTVPGFRLWIDCSYAEYAWDTLVEICESLGGRIVGAGALFPSVRL